MDTKYRYDVVTEFDDTMKHFEFSNIAQILGYIEYELEKARLGVTISFTIDDHLKSVEDNIDPDTELSLIEVEICCTI